MGSGEGQVYNTGDWRQWKDYFNNEIKVGDLVLYPNRQGSSLWMNHGTVLALGHTDDKPSIMVKKVTTNYRGEFMGHREVTIQCLNRVIALGRGHGDFGFVPRKASSPDQDLSETWLDRVMKWIRS